MTISDIIINILYFTNNCISHCFDDDELPSINLSKKKYYKKKI